MRCTSGFMNDFIFDGTGDAKRRILKANQQGTASKTSRQIVKLAHRGATPTCGAQSDI